MVLCHILVFWDQRIYGKHRKGHIIEQQFTVSKVSSLQTCDVFEGVEFVFYMAGRFCTWQTHAQETNSLFLFWYFIRGSCADFWIIPLKIEWINILLSCSHQLKKRILFLEWHQCRRKSGQYIIEHNMMSDYLKDFRTGFIHLIDLSPRRDAVGIFL